ncbi:putative mitochondrial hypothetical protein [Leptomonas pyrrhocoris]|uniref:Oxidation resistance protein 1 n=1 Tax=Leptomonas pyrrhocoris TaxID=157538 RepID=A0A0M9G6R5_LEPPY|nr:putative mitochondrial hypothetical protein [Leptomonas pyrrhocoris]XP_015662149.1 putative mitochondrial hypothetical protein [Leptomonas pyrrhocoris]KPA83709.1 putative mitochondrial hypothetical protein [Leptomonas pyrrhocoris]KPA83710.1 putative mitochondrial hypothetical protein [Leptomonas pyrrhocoris]|eukprot:XP_015662148.1 putative mitochondrial hypothetical protein [Leptomonas pyrrhocoris]
MDTSGGALPPSPSSRGSQKAVLSHYITPPGTARRIVPTFPPPGCHFYDSYLNCFQYRPEVRGKLLDAARRHTASRHSALYADDHPPPHALPGTASDTGAALPCNLDDPSLRADPRSRLQCTACRCGLKAVQLFATSQDLPQPPLPLSKCELHEVLLSLPPRWQNYPWRLCFDTARDGFSLSTLYRCMEAVEEQQRRAKTVAFGLLFVYQRDDAPMDPSVSAGSSICNSPAASGNSKSFQQVHRARSLRYGALRGTLPYGVIGCFTPVVPSLAHHAANIYFGSEESYVFRLDQLGLSPDCGVWMQRDFAIWAEQQATAAAAASKAKEAAGEGVRDRQGTKNAAAGGAPARSLSRSGVSPSSNENSSLNSPPLGALRSVPGLARLSDGAEQTHVPVPRHTHMTVERVDDDASAEAVNGKFRAEKAAASPSLADASAGATAAKKSSSLPTLTAAATVTGASATPPSSSKPTSPSQAGGKAVVHRSLHSSSVRGVVPRAPLLTKYGWSGRLDNRKFVVCNPRFLALGAGKSGAALFVDEALQFGTSSNYCETFDAPCLFGPRPVNSPSASSLSSPSMAQPSATQRPPQYSTSTCPKAAQLAETFPGPPGSLSHREFAIRRVVWFSITEDRRTFRLMNGAGAASVVATTTMATDGSAGDAVAGADNHLCRCGRVGRTAEPEVADGGHVSSSGELNYLHTCDLLPFTEQPY